MADVSDRETLFKQWLKERGNPKWEPAIMIPVKAAFYAALSSRPDVVEEIECPFCDGAFLYTFPARPDLADTARLDFLQSGRYEMSEVLMDEDGITHAIYEVDGGRNDREWTRIGAGTDLRSAIDVAILSTPDEEATS